MWAVRARSGTPIPGLDPREEWRATRKSILLARRWRSLFAQRVSQACRLLRSFLDSVIRCRRVSVFHPCRKPRIRAARRGAATRAGPRFILHGRRSILAGWPSGSPRGQISADAPVSGRRWDKSDNAIQNRSAGERNLSPIERETGYESPLAGSKSSHRPIPGAES